MRVIRDCFKKSCVLEVEAEIRTLRDTVHSQEEAALDRREPPRILEAEPSCASLVPKELGGASSIPNPLHQCGLEYLGVEHFLSSQGLLSR